MKIKEKLLKLFNLDKLNFTKIEIKKEVIEDINSLAKNSYPKEFIAFLTGKIEKKVLIIDSLTSQKSESSENSVFFDRLKLPLISNIFGSVHSHPSYSNKPSNADLKFFNKTGGIHIIICKPFGIKNINVCDCYGNKMYWKTF